MAPDRRNEFVLLFDRSSVAVARVAAFAATLVPARKKTRQDAPGRVDGGVADIQHPPGTDRSVKRG
jgi:hypothetical protein